MCKSKSYIKCFKSRDDNFSSKWAIFQTHFSWLLVDPKFLYSYGGQYMFSIAPHKSLKIWGQPGAKKSASELHPY